MQDIERQACCSSRCIMKVDGCEDHVNGVGDDDGAADLQCPLSPLSPAESLESLPPDTPADHHHAMLFKGGPSTGGLTGDGMCDSGIYARLGYPSPPSTTSDPKHPVPLPPHWDANTNTTMLALGTTSPDHDHLNDYLDFDIDLCYDLATLSFPSTSASASALVYFGGPLDSPRVDVHRHSRHQALIAHPGRNGPGPPSPTSPMRHAGVREVESDAEDGMGAWGGLYTEVNDEGPIPPYSTSSSKEDSTALLSPLSPEWDSRTLDSVPLTTSGVGVLRGSTDESLPTDACNRITVHEPPSPCDSSLRQSRKNATYIGLHPSYRSRSPTTEPNDPPRQSSSPGTTGSRLGIYPLRHSSSTSSVRSTASSKPVLPLLDIPQSNHPLRSYDPSPSSPLWLAHSHLPSPTSPPHRDHDRLEGDEEMVSPPSSGPPDTPSPDFGPLALLEDVYEDHQLADLWDLDGSGSLGLDEGNGASEGWKAKSPPSSPDTSPAFDWVQASEGGHSVWNAYDHDPRLLQSPSSALRSFSDLPSSIDEDVSPRDPYDSFSAHYGSNPLGADFDDSYNGPLLFEFSPNASPVFSRAASPEIDFNISVLDDSPLLKDLQLPSEEEEEVKACIRIGQRAGEAERVAGEKERELDAAKLREGARPPSNVDPDEFRVAEGEDGLVRLQREAVEARAFAKRERDKAREVGALVRAKLRERGWGQDVIWDAPPPVSPRLQKSPRMASVAHLVAKMFLNRHDLPTSPPPPSSSLLSATTSAPATKLPKYKYRPIWLRSLSKAGGLHPGDTRATYQKRYKLAGDEGGVEEEEEKAALRRPSLWDAEGELDAL
ncbi:hypothetical protein DFP72DRAFT_919394 [Ephemerocybe angulata]|uniref:Uncharacterized protein n=1 Tax=Ephemerocybe angulata TaxID=980116 RepID=A0A8H6HJV3_9AGAR|nr:hypothetical protein DFP72DRAFT_919394 [Tulosesus angulatus]